jgi:hypothetical protein
MSGLLGRPRAVIATVGFVLFVTAMFVMLMGMPAFPQLA